MRGAIALIIGGGLLLGGVLPTQDTALAESGGPVGTAGTTAPASTRTVVYNGYEISVPANWPVYRLDEEPQQCVRYDRHAVYLGMPGANQLCPAELIGRTETVSILPVATYGPSASTERFTSAAGTLPRLRGVVLQNPGDHVLQVVPVANRSVTVTATYDSDLTLAEQMLATLRRAPAGTPWTRATTAGIASSRAAATSTAAGAALDIGAVRFAQAAPHGTQWAAHLRVSPPWHGLPAPWPTEASQQSPVKPKHRRPVLGFDTCGPPSQAALRSWRRDYSVVAVYIGGVNAACYDGNLSASWIDWAANLGWSMLPTYVGPQAPCYGYGTMIRLGKAAREGTAAAQDAAWDAWRLGLRARSPIYYDMEAYTTQDPSCTASVIAFLGAWTREIDAKGYTSGVYSSMDPGIGDMQSAAMADRHGFTRPQAIWYALWNRKRELNDTSLSWPRGKRSKQFIGPHNVTIGGITMNVDTDLVDGPTAR